MHYNHGDYTGSRPMIKEIKQGNDKPKGKMFTVLIFLFFSRENDDRIAAQTLRHLCLIVAAGN